MPSKPDCEPRKIPRQARSTETVNAILEAAARILEQHGHSGFNTNAVAQLAGVSPGSLYQYFPNKKSLIRSLILREKNIFLFKFLDIYNNFIGIDALLNLIDVAVDQQFERCVLTRLLDLEEALLIEDKEIQQIDNEVAKIVYYVLNQCKHLIFEDNQATKFCLDTIAYDLIAIVKGMVNEASIRGEQDIILLKHRVIRATFGYIGLRKMEKYLT